jgi:hypothetical protein
MASFKLFCPVPTTTTTTTAVPTAAAFFFNNTDPLVPLTISIAFNSVTVISSQVAAANTITTFTPNPASYTPSVNTLIEVTYSGYIPTSADLFFNAVNHSADSLGNPATWNSIDTTGTITSFEFTFGTT